VNILIADAMSDKVVDILRSHNLSVDVKTDLKKEELQNIIGGYHALIVRSTTKVTRRHHRKSGQSEGDRQSGYRGR